MNSTELLGLYAERITAARDYLMECQDDEWTRDLLEILGYGRSGVGFTNAHPTPDPAGAEMTIDQIITRIDNDITPLSIYAKAEIAGWIEQHVAEQSAPPSEKALREAAQYFIVNFSGYKARAGDKLERVTMIDCGLRLSRALLAVLGKVRP
jgi:hypothetical protein